MLSYLYSFIENWKTPYKTVPSTIESPKTVKSENCNVQKEKTKIFVKGKPINENHKPGITHRNKLF